MKTETVKKELYIAPVIETIEIESEGIICSSEPKTSASDFTAGQSFGDAGEGIW